eukprot:gene6153-12463_t
MEVLNEPSSQYAIDFLNDASMNVDLNFRPIGVLPGDDVTEKISSFKTNIKIGQNLLQHRNTVICTSAGTLRYRPPVTYWIENSRKRYFPRTGDQVLGLIEDKGGDFYRVNIFSGSVALLNRLGFEGATKRNKPELKIGDVVYCRINSAHKDVDTELTCTTAAAIKKEWSSGETVYGSLSEGVLVRVSLGLARRLLHPECAVLNTLGRKLSFEVVIGMNGAVWIKSGSVLHTVLIRNAILNAESLTVIEEEAMVGHLLSKFS